MHLTHKSLHFVVVTCFLLVVGCSKSTPTKTTTVSKAPKAPVVNRDQHYGQTEIDLEAERNTAVNKPRSRNAESLSHREIIERGESEILYIVVRDATGEDIAVAVHQATEWSADLQFDLAISSGVLPKLREHLKSDEASRRDSALRVAIDAGAAAAKPLADLIESMLTSPELRLRDDAYTVMLAMNPGEVDKIKLPKLKRFQV